jgi:glycerophosphoryl diester phosphodiesterase
LLDTDTPERIWTVDSPLRAKKIIEYGAAGFFTNKFEDMMDLRKRVANY